MSQIQILCKGIPSRDGGGGGIPSNPLTCVPVRVWPQLCCSAGHIPLSGRDLVSSGEGGGVPSNPLTCVSVRVWPQLCYSAGHIPLSGRDLVSSGGGGGGVPSNPLTCVSVRVWPQLCYSAGHIPLSGGESGHRQESHTVRPPDWSHGQHGRYRPLRGSGHDLHRSAERTCADHRQNHHN